MSLVIPTRSDISAYSETVDLVGTIFEFSFAWNTRAQVWVMGISTQVGEPILQGVTLVADTDLLGGHVDDRLPDGVIVALDTTRKGEQAGRLDLGSRALVIFTPADEFEALSA